MDLEEIVFLEMLIGTTETMIATVDKDLVALWAQDPVRKMTDLVVLWAQDLARKMVLCAAMLEMAKTSSRFLFIPFLRAQSLKPELPWLIFILLVGMSSYGHARAC